MKERMHFAESVPLFQDEHGRVRVKGSRVTLDTLIGNFKKGYKPKVKPPNRSAGFLESVPRPSKVTALS